MKFVKYMLKPANLLSFWGAAAVCMATFVPFTVGQLVSYVLGYVFLTAIFYRLD